MQASPTCTDCDLRVPPQRRAESESEALADLTQLSCIGSAGHGGHALVLPAEDSGGIEVGGARTAGAHPPGGAEQSALRTAVRAGADPGFRGSGQGRGQAGSVGGAEHPRGPLPQGIMMVLRSDQCMRDLMQDDAPDRVRIVQIRQRSG